MQNGKNYKSVIIKLFVVFLLFIMFGTSGCTTNKGTIPSSLKVSIYATKNIPELCKRISVEHMPAGEKAPAKDIYTYKSVKRELYFHITSTLTNISIDGPTAFYTKIIYDDYKVSEYNQMPYEINQQFEYKRDYNMALLKIPVYRKEDVDKYLYNKYGLNLGEVLYLSTDESEDLFNKIKKDNIINDFFHSYYGTNAIYVSDLHVSRDINKYNPYILYNELTINDDEILLDADICEYKNSKLGKDVYYVGIVFLSVEDDSRKLLGGFK